MESHCDFGRDGKNLGVLKLPNGLAEVSVFGCRHAPPFNI
jgi:hypothetical protein